MTTVKALFIMHNGQCIIFLPMEGTGHYGGGGRWVRKGGQLQLFLPIKKCSIFDIYHPPPPLPLSMTGP